MSTHLPCRHLLLILGDQLDEDSSAFLDMDPERDVVLIVEAFEESTHVASHKVRTALFLSAMRHFAQGLEARGFRLHYRALDKEGDANLGSGLKAALRHFKPQRVIGVEPGDLRVRDELNTACAEQKVALEWREDRHFLCSALEFCQWAGKSSSLRMEFFYRRMRQRHKVLMDGDEPIGGQWNFDAENRKGFGRAGPQALPQPPVFKHDTITRDVLDLVEKHFPQNPGSLAHFNWPVTRQEALLALQDFIAHRLPLFGQHQDAMWTGMSFGWHALLSSALNLKLLNPLEVVQAAEQAFHARDLPLASVEGFIRQVLGWREFIRGVYFLDMPELKQANHYEHERALPPWYWTAQTKMNCMRESVGQTLAHGYSHHIQRLMITGMFGVIAEIKPQALCDWYLGMYVDAVEWVELPNTAGMALFANGGRFTSKPYVASGAYVKRMSNYCSGCAYKPDEKTGPTACPMTTLYWNFLDKH
jgi:deoxyribodipyrimidine photolyase-related protein